MYEEEPIDLVDDIIRPDPKLGDVIEQCAIHQTLGLGLGLRLGLGVRASSLRQQ